MLDTKTPADHPQVPNLEKIAVAEAQLGAIIDDLTEPNGRGASRAISLAITKLQEASFWLSEAMYGR